LVNVVEIVVFEMLDKVLEKKDMCKCERCKMDIAAITLNNLPPNYVASIQGEVLKAIGPQLKIDVRREIENAVALVLSRPHHKRGG
jgi:competence protein ComFB